MKIFKTLRKRGLALFLVLTMCMSLLPANALAAEVEALAHTCNEDGWTCVQTDKLTCKEEHDHVAECYEWTHTAPSDNVKLFLQAVKDLPNEVTEADAEKAASARAAYGDLDATEQANNAVVAAHDALAKAEETLETLAAEAEAAAKLEEAVQAFLTAVEPVPAEGASEADAEAVASARSAYDALPEAGKADERVTAAYGKLESAEAALEAIKAEQTQAAAIAELRATLAEMDAFVLTEDEASQEAYAALGMKALELMEALEDVDYEGKEEDMILFASLGEKQTGGVSTLAGSFSVSVGEATTLQGSQGNRGQNHW